MDELLAALEEPPRHRRPWFSAIAAIATLAVATAAFAARREPVPCTGAQAAMAEAWGAQQREQVERAFGQSGASYAPEAAQQARRELDRYASTWVRMHTRSCEATAIRGEQSSDVLDLQMGCLHRAKTELSAVARLLSQADAKVVENAHEMVARLPPLERCADVEALRSELEPPAAHERAAVDATRLHLAEVKALRDAGKYEQAVLAMDAVEQARTGTYYPPLQAEVFYELGRTQQLRAAYDEAESALRSALSLALQTNHRSIANAAATELIYLMGVIRGRPTTATVYAEAARGLLVASEATKESEIFLGKRIGVLLRDQGRYAEAEAAHRAALKSALELWDPRHPDVSELRVELAIVLRLEGQYDDALDQLRTALEEQQHALGPDHPHVASIHNSLANALGAQERHEEAEHEYREALRIWSDALGTETMEVATVRSNLGNTLEMLGRYEEAESEIRAAMKSWTVQLGPDHPYIGIAHANLGHLYRDQGQLDRALSEFRASQALYTAAYGPEHPHVANARAAIATILHARGQLAEAEAEARIVLEISEEALAHVPNHPDLLTAFDNLALILLSRDKVAEALPLLEKAWLGRAEQPPSATKAGTAFGLAQALVETAGDCDRARALAEAAREICTAPENDCLPEETSAVAEFLRGLRCRS